MANGSFRLGKQSGGTLGLVFPDGVSNTEVVLPDSGNIASVDTAVTDNAIARYDGTTGKVQNSGVVIDDDGNVGVGTSSPYYKIHIVGNPSYNGVLRIEAGGTTTTDAVLDLTARGSNGVYNNAEIRAIGSTGKGTTLEFYTDNPAGPITRQMSLNSSGNLLLTSGTGGLGYGAGAGGTVTQLTSKSTGITVNKPSGTIYTHNESLAAGASVSFPFNNNLLDGYSFGDTLVVNGAYTPTAINPDGFYRIEATMVGSGGGRIRITNLTGAARAEVLAINFSIVKGARV